MTATIPNRRDISLQSGRAAHTTNSVGMVLALVSFTMMFGGLFYSYGLLRVRSVAWPPAGVPEMPLIIPTGITLMLAGSAVALEFGRKRLRRNDIAAFQRLSMVAIVLGALFLGLQASVWIDLWEAGLTLAVGPYGSMFYFLTAFHALHVVAGLGILGWMYVAAPRASSPVIRDSRAHLSAVFWHFVGAVWLIIFFLAYVF
jgi:cytochrome c oxidase subunit 3